jgi:NAD(P)-dependent dehydrogenase (short-subunit alcohol dehydrogenase family)
MSIVYFITGANRGIGLGLVKALLARPLTTVIATVRNAEAAASLELEVSKLSNSESSALHIKQLDLSTAPSTENIIELLPASVGHIDVLINNAAIIAPMSPVLATTAEHLRVSFEANTIGPLIIFQALWPLMERAKTPKLINISSSVGCITEAEPVPGGAYGPSKTALNWLTKQTHIQHPGLIAIALHPGWVKTRAGEFCVKEWDYPGEPPVTIDDSVNGILSVIEDATRESDSGNFISYNGDILKW